MEKERATLGLKILCFFIPLAGLLIYACNISINKDFAKDCGKAALFGFLLPFIIAIIILIYFGIFLVSKNATSNMLNSYSENNFSYVPDLVGLHKDEATSQLEDLGFNMEILSNVSSNEWPKDYVLSQSYESGHKLKKGTTIGVTISQGM